MFSFAKNIELSSLFDPNFSVEPVALLIQERETSTYIEYPILWAVCVCSTNVESLAILDALNYSNVIATLVVLMEKRNGEEEWRRGMEKKKI